MGIAIGARGKEVVELQLKLKALGYQAGDVDGKFGPKTKTALEQFQHDYESLETTGVLDIATDAALAQALALRQIDDVAAGGLPPPVPCAADTWAAFKDLVGVVTSTPVRYGPGRGLCSNGKWIVTHGPGDVGRKSWASQLGTTYPSFHCSSWTNFFLGWLLRYNENYTHAGNIPSLFDLCEQSDELHDQKDGGKYRGYGPYCRAIPSNGDTVSRVSGLTGLDIRELYERRATLPTFIICGQSTRQEDGRWKEWHHTVLFVVDHSDPGKAMHRLAADGYQANGRWSARAMVWQSINEDTLKEYQRCIYRAYGVVSADGTYGGGRPILPVSMES